MNTQFVICIYAIWWTYQCWWDNAYCMTAFQKKNIYCKRKHLYRHEFSFKITIWMCLTQKAFTLERTNALQMIQLFFLQIKHYFFYIHTHTLYTHIQCPHDVFVAIFFNAYDVWKFGLTCLEFDVFEYDVFVVSLLKAHRRFTLSRQKMKCICQCIGPH